MKKLIFDTSDELINWLNNQDLVKYDVGLGLNGRRDKDGWEMFPYQISGYLFEKDNPVNICCPFTVMEAYSKGDKRGIKRIRNAIAKEWKDAYHD